MENSSFWFACERVCLCQIFSSVLQKRGYFFVQKVPVFLYSDLWKSPQKTLSVGASSRIFLWMWGKVVNLNNFAVQGNLTAVFQGKLWAVNDHLLLMSKFSTQILGCADYNGSQSERKQIKQGYQIWPIYFNQDIWYKVRMMIINILKENNLDNFLMLMESKKRIFYFFFYMLD